MASLPSLCVDSRLNKEKQPVQTGSLWANRAVMNFMRPSAVGSVLWAMRVNVGMQV